MLSLGWFGFFGVSEKWLDAAQYQTKNGVFLTLSSSLIPPLHFHPSR